MNAMATSPDPDDGRRGREWERGCKAENRAAPETHADREQDEIVVLERASHTSSRRCDDKKFGEMIWPFEQPTGRLAERSEHAELLEDARNEGFDDESKPGEDERDADGYHPICVRDHTDSSEENDDADDTEQSEIFQHVLACTGERNKRRGSAFGRERVTDGESIKG